MGVYLDTEGKLHIWSPVLNRYVKSTGEKYVRQPGLTNDDLYYESRDIVTEQYVRLDTPLTEYTEEGVMKKILDYIPWHWRNVVCTCYNPTDEARSTRCGECHLYRRWTYRASCKSCGKAFIHLFTHEAADGKTCYTCLTTKFGAGGNNPVTELPEELPDLTTVKEVTFTSFTF